MFQKITYGYVIQEFDEDKEPVFQNFVAGDQVEYTNDQDDETYNVDIENLPYVKFEMIQPSDFS